MSELEGKIHVYEEATKRDALKATTTKEKEEKRKKKSDRKPSKSDKWNRCYNCEVDLVVNGRSIVSSVDTGSDICVIQQKAFEQYNLGQLLKCNFEFDGIGAHNRTLGNISIKIEVDSDCYDDFEDQENFRN